MNRANNTRLTQQGCQILWSLCLPLLQPGIRKQVRKALQLIVECLENIDRLEKISYLRIELNSFLSWIAKSALENKVDRNKMNLFFKSVIKTDIKN